MLSYDVVAWGRPLERIERETPDPKGTEVLIRMKYCGVCHSDVHIRDGYFDLGGGKRLHMGERGMFPPVTLGHEPFGTIVAAGPEATDAPIGCDRLVYPWTGCGQCARCTEQRDNFCRMPHMIGIQRPGGYADHLIVPHPRYLIDSAGLDPAWAATLSCSGLSAHAAVAKLQPIPDDEWVAVIGAGGLGLAAIGMLLALGHRRVIAVDVDRTKLRMAENCGAAASLVAGTSDAVLQLKQTTNGALYGALDFVGTTETGQLALGALRKGGKLVLVGLFGGQISLSIASAILGAVMIQGSHLGSVAELKAVVALAREGKIRPIPIEKRSLTEVSRTLDELKMGKVTGRVVLEV